MTFEDGADNELTIEEMDELPESMSTSIAATLQVSPLSGVSVEDFVSFIVDVEGTFMGASYNSDGTGILPLTYAAFKEEGNTDLYQPLTTGEGAVTLEPIGGDFGQDFKNKEISSVVIAVLAQGVENTDDILGIVKEALSMKVCGE